MAHTRASFKAALLDWGIVPARMEEPIYKYLNREHYANNRVHLTLSPQGHAVTITIHPKQGPHISWRCSTWEEAYTKLYDYLEKPLPVVEPSVLRKIKRSFV